MNPYIEEAVLITKDLGDVTFVGAVAVFLHTKKSRESKDLDFVVADQITREQFLHLKYKFINENGKERIYTPKLMHKIIQKKDTKYYADTLWGL